MKSALLFLVAMLSLSTAAAVIKTPLELKQAVAHRLDGIAGDTVNEGMQEAHVIYNGRTPRVNCKISPSRQEPGKNWAFCSIDFLVSYEEARETRTCRVLFSYDPSDIKGTLIDDDEDTSECIQWLGESIE